MRVCIVGVSGKLVENEGLVREAPAIVGCQMPSALAHAAR
jgi:hypothetical protein